MDYSNWTVGIDNKTRERVYLKNPTTEELETCKIIPRELWTEEDFKNIFNKAR